MGNKCLARGGPFDPGAVLDQVHILFIISNEGGPVKGFLQISHFCIASWLLHLTAPVVGLQAALENLCSPCTFLKYF